MAFARQMNPEKYKEFMSTYEAVTDKSHGNLQVDVKQASHDWDRWKENVLDQSEDAAVDIKEEESLPELQFESNSQSVHIGEDFTETEHSEKSLARSMLFYSRNCSQQI